MLPNLNTLAERLKWAREKESQSQTSLASKLGVSQGAVEKTENGKTVKPKFLPEASKILDVPYEWLARGTIAYNESQSNPTALNENDTAPVYGYAAGSNEKIALNTGQIVEHRTRGNALRNTPDGFYVVAIGDSMEPACEAGFYLAVNPMMPPAKGKLCVIEFNDGHAVVKAFKTMDENSVKVKQYNPIKDIEYKREEVKTVYAVQSVEW